MIDEIKKLLELKKQQQLTNEDLEKIETIEDILQEENWMFKLDMDTVVGMLEFLGVPDNKIMKVYSSLTSSDSYLKHNIKERISFRI